jgi:ketosteroid isomerase-like protein
MSFLWTSKMTAQKTADIAKKFFDAIEAGEIDVVYNMFTADAKIWHNTDQLVVPRETTAKTLRGMHKHFTNIAYLDRKLESWSTGFVERHVLAWERKADGVQTRMPVCIVCEINGDGKITRLDEYFDSAAQNGVAQRTPKSKI